LFRISPTRQSGSSRECTGLRGLGEKKKRRRK
jgi:hypothetical protein